MSWWQSLYDDLVADVLLAPRAPGEIEATADFIASRLALPAGARIFDQCCGIGSVAAPLAAAGYEVLGVDQAAGYVERARTVVPGARFICADAADFVCEPPAAGAINWGTSFGYSMNDADNQRILDRAFESLIPGGRLIVDVLALPGVLRHFRPVMIDRVGDIELRRETSIDLAAGAMDKTWTFTTGGGAPVTRQSRIKLYLPHQIAALLAAAGFEVLQLLGGPGGEPLSIDSLRCVIVARSPA
jgi:SAM-dependent methyltransferase